MDDLLYVWAGDVDEQDPDFLAVIDARAESPEYGRVITTIPVEGRANLPHHTEYALTSPGSLFANGWGSGKTFIFDLSVPRAPKVSRVVASRGGYAYPHSYARLSNRDVLATFQSTADAYAPPGALVRLDERGEVISAVSGASPSVPTTHTWPYSLLVLEDLDRVITTNTRMGLPAEWKSAMHAATDASHEHVSHDVKSTHVQIWRLSDLTLLHTLQLPPQGEGQNAWTAEPRRLANGEVFINTFSCGLYRIVGLTTEAPVAVAAGFSPFKEPAFCAVPVVVGNYWIHPSATERVILTYDLSDPAHPREVARLPLDPDFTNPHWLATDPSGSRIVVTADDAAWVLIVNVDRATGKLSIDPRFREPSAARPGLTFDRIEWPHGRTGKAQPHGAVFSVR